MHFEATKARIWGSLGSLQKFRAMCSVVLRNFIPVLVPGALTLTTTLEEKVL